MTETVNNLTAKQQCFVDEYIIDFNGTAAAIRAGYSARSAKQLASRLLESSNVQAAIAVAIEARRKRTNIDADWVLRRLAEEAEADFGELFDDSGKMLPVKDWPRVWRTGLVSGIESFEEYEGRGAEREAVGMVRKIKLTERIKHLELIGKHVDVRAFREQIGLSDPKGKPLAPPVFNLSFADGGPGE